jgi:pimeloyl-ACP methyl ester carboxylesterase
MPFRLDASVLALSTILTAGCATGAVREPRLHTVQIGDRSKTLVVMLPGIKDRAEQFLVAGFVGGDAVPDAFDVLVVEPEMSDYVRGTLVERLRTQIIEPAQARGYDEIWLLGVSIGGYGSLLYAGAFPADIRGVVLLAPYLGGRRLPRTIAAAGGLAIWPPGTESHPRPFVRGWRALKALTQGSDTMVVLGFGGGDPLAETYMPLLEALPRSQIYTAAGGHEWSTWTPLWHEIKATIDSAPRAQ